MKTATACIGSMACLALALVPTTRAQEKPAVQTTESGFHRMEIYNGPMRTVYYSSVGASTGEQAALREVERSENEAALANQLLALRRQYVNDESVLENRRRQVQELFYGYWSVANPGLYTGAVATTYPYGYSYYAPYNYGYTYGYPYGYTTYGSPYYTGAGLTAVNGLYGVGDEGPIKTEFARTLAIQATPEYAAQAHGQYSNALAQAAEGNSRIANLVGVSSKGGVRPAQYQPPPGPSRLPGPGTQVVVRRRVGASVEKVEGKIISQTGDWIILDTKGGRLTIVKSDIVDILEPK